MSTQIGPGLRHYLGKLEGDLRKEGLKGPLLVMQRSGGAITAPEAPATAISTVGSVLTGGVVGAIITVVRELSDPAAFPLDPLRVSHNIERLEREVTDVIKRQGLRLVGIELHREIDIRYGMQMGEIATPLADGAITAETLHQTSELLEKLYAQLYGEGSGFRDAGIQGLTYRIRGVGVLAISLELPEIGLAQGADAEQAAVERRQICLDGREGYVDTPVYDYTKLRAGHVIEGPAVGQVPTTAVVVPKGMRGTVDKLGKLSINTNVR